MFRSLDIKSLKTVPFEVFKFIVVIVLLPSFFWKDKQFLPEESTNINVINTQSKKVGKKTFKGLHFEIRW